MSALHWFRLTFPRDLAPEAVVAVLSGLSGIDAGSRLVFDLAADAGGITHHVGVTPNVVDALIAELRTAIPSLRVDGVELDQAPSTHRLLWQLAPAVAAIRTDHLEAIAASLLASFYPLSKGEVVRLRWTLRPAVRPSLPTTEGRNQGRLRMLRDKLALPGMRGYGELDIVAGDAQRTRHLSRRTSAVLRSVSTPNGELVGEPVLYGQLARLLGRRGRYYSVREICAVIGWPLASPDVPGLALGSSKRLLPSVALPRAGRVLGASDFAGMGRPVAITPAASTRGCYILGPTGSGKTSLIKNLIRDDLEQNRGVCVVETNGDLIADILDIIPEHRIGDVVLLDPADSEYAVGFNPLAGSGDASLAADQIVELFERLWRQYWGPRTAQIAHMGLLTLAQRSGSLVDLPRLFTDARFRAATIGHLDDPVGLEPDWAWFTGLSEAEKFHVTAPLRNKVRAFTARRSIRGIIGQVSPKITMRQVMAQQKVLLVNVPKGLIGAETSRLLGCLVLTSLWQAATERARLPVSRRRPFGLYVDEVQDFAAAPVPWDEMFSQGRKYGLAVTAAHQNLSQIPQALRETIHANARSKAVFALSASDARVMAQQFSPSLTAADLMALDAYVIAAVVALDDGSTARPVTLATPPPPQASGIAEQVRQASRTNYARLRSEVEAELRRQIIPKPPTAPLGSKPRTP